MDIKDLQKEIVQTDEKTVAGRLFLIEREHGKQRTRPDYDHGDKVCVLLRRLQDLQQARRDAKAEILDSLSVEIGEDGKVVITANNLERFKTNTAIVRSCEQRIAVMERVVGRLDEMGVVSWQDVVSDQSGAQTELRDSRSKLDSVVRHEPQMVMGGSSRVKEENERNKANWEGKKKEAEKRITDAQANLTAKEARRNAVGALLHEAGIF